MVGRQKSLLNKREWVAVGERLSSLKSSSITSNKSKNRHPLVLALCMTSSHYQPFPDPLTHPQTLFHSFFKQTLQTTREYQEPQPASPSSPRSAGFPPSRTPNRTHRCSLDSSSPSPSSNPHSPPSPSLANPTDTPSDPVPTRPEPS